MVGLAALVLGQLERARTSFAEAIGIFSAANDVSAFTVILDSYAALAMADHQPARAVRLTGAAAALRERTGAELGVLTKEFGGAELYPTHVELAAYPGEWEAGRAMDASAAVAYALAQDGS